jgi:dTDP-4-dehydrorhamnose reductase
MRIAITGAAGGLGQALVDLLARGDHEVRAFTHADLDIGDAAAVRTTIARLEPDVLLNAAAFSNVDACEDAANLDRMMAGNVLGPLRLAEAAEACGATLVHVSTDYVFPGDKGSPYDERDEPRPINRYGASKLEGEDRVRGTTDRHVIVRTAFVFGSGRDFLTRALRRLAAGEDAGALVDRVGSPTYVRHLAERLLPLARTERFGTYHLAGPEPTTWHDVLTRAQRLAPGRLTGALAEQHAAELDLAAPRPRDSSLESALLTDLADDVPPMPPLDAALEEHLATLFPDLRSV